MQQSAGLFRETNSNILKNTWSHLYFYTHFSVAASIQDAIINRIHSIPVVESMRIIFTFS